MRRRERGVSLLWMLLLAWVLMAAVVAIGLLGVGLADAVDHAATADAASRSGATVLAERLRHIARVQKIGLKALEDGNTDLAKECAKLAGHLASRTPELAEQEARRVAGENRATRTEFAISPSPFVRVQKGGLTWIGLNPDARDGCVAVTTWKPSRVDGSSRSAKSTARVRSEQGWPQEEPVTQDDWLSRLGKDKR